MTQASQRLAHLTKERQELVERVLRKEGHAPAAPTLNPRAPELRELPLSYAQESLWFMCHLASSNAVYNLPSAIRLLGPMDCAALGRSIGELVRRHEILRTRFPAPSGRPLQEVLPAHRFELQVVTCTGASPDERLRYALRLASEECTRPFDLAEAPPWRLCLYELGPEDHLLLTVFHHLVWDGWSIGVWIRELAVLYESFRQGRPSPLPELSVQYADYALFQREWLSGERLDAHVAWWQERLRGVPSLELPMDRPRPARPTYDGATEPILFPPALSAAVEELCHRTGTTPYMLLLAAFQALLHRYAGQERIVVGTPIASRRQREIEGLIGHFANIVLMATDLSGEPTFAELLSRVRETATGSYAHQDIPFELLVDRLGVERDASRNPLFQVMFALHQEQLAALELPGLQVAPVPVDSERSHFDLGLHLWRSAHGIHGHMSYSKDLFDPSTIRRMLGHYLTLLEASVREPERSISSLPLLTEEERRWLQQRSRVDPPRNEPSPVEALFARRAAATPEAPALLWREGELTHLLTFGALRERAGQLARHLIQRGRPRVGLYLGPGPETLVALLGALEAGVTFVPMNPEDPATRRAAIVEDARVALLLTRRELAAGLEETGWAYLCLDEALPDTPHSPPGDPEDLACLTYASGRRVSLPRHALALRIARLDEWLSLEPGELLIATAPPGRDFFAVELLWPLTRGATIALAATDETGLPVLPSSAQPIGIAHLTPARLSRLLEHGPEETLTRLAHARTLACSGGLPRSGLVEHLQRPMSSRRLYLYAPPELGIEVACWPLSMAAPAEAPKRVPLWLLDARANPVPIGVPGTLHAGVGQNTPTTPEVSGDVVPTAERGVWLEDGTLRLLGSAPRTVWHDGLRLHLADLEAALLQHPALASAHVLARPGRSGEELVCHVVPSGTVTREQLAGHVRRHLPTPGLPVSFVLLGALPLTPEGRVDEQALLALPILDEDLVAAEEKRLAQLPGVARVKVLARERLEPQTFLHVSDLLPDCRPPRALERHTTSSSGTVSRQPGGSAPARLAHARGAPLPIPDDAPKTISEALLRTAGTWPERGITFWQNIEGPTHLTYPELLHRARCILSGLRARGLQAQDSAILQLEDLRDHLCAFWACILGGITPVNVATSATYEQKTGVVGKLYNVWKLLGHPVVISSARLVEPLAGVPALYRTGSEPIEPLRALSIDELSAHPPAETLHAASPRDVAFLQLSSGSTGVPKCIQETHESLVDHVHGVRAVNGYGPEDVSLNWLPFDHVVPTLTCHLKDTYLGIPQIHAKTDLVLTDPLLWLDLIDRHRVTHSWAPNFGFKLVSEALARQSGRRWELGSVQRLMNAGEQVTLPVCEEFLRRTASFGMKPTVMQPGFGMAEVCTMVTYANDWTPQTGTFRVRKTSLGGRLEEAAEGEDAIAFVDLGPVRPGVEMRIAGPDNQVLPECVIGVLQFRGPVTTPGYLHNPEANREAFVGDGWFSSGDLGFIRDGRLAITGRQKEVIIVRGANFYCYEIEDAVNDTPGVEPTFSAACAVDDPSTGSEGLAIFFVPREPGLDLSLVRAVRERVSRGFGVSPAFVVPLDKAAFPKTTSGKIQRTQLKKDLLAGRFDALLKQMDLAVENEQSLPHWFHRPIWRRRELESAPGPLPRGNALVLCDEDGLGALLCEHLGARAVRVERGAAFARVGPRAYTLDPLEPAHYDALLSSLEEERLALEHVFHLWSYGPPGPEPESADALAQASRRTSGSLLLLAQALARRSNAPPVQLLVATSHTQEGAPGERIAYERAALRGLVKSLPQEWPTLGCRHVELPSQERQANAGRLLREASAVTKDREVLYRQGGRWIERLAPVKPEATGGPPWKRGDLVLLSGGLGGIGTELARELLEQHGLRLLLVGRTPLEGDEMPAGEVDALATRRTREERLQALRELERLGPVHHEVADVGDLDRLRKVVARAEQRFETKLAGIIHLAGVFPTRLLAEETPESLAETVYPKLVGAWTLRQLLGDEGFFLGFGSVYGLFGGVGVGAYAAAHGALEAFLAEERRKGHARRHCLSFSHWDDLGMSRGYQLVEQSLARGYMMIGRKRGLYSLLAGLRSNHAQLVVGLDGRKPNVRCHLEAPTTPLERLQAYLAPSSGTSPPASLRMESLTDRFGTPARCELVVVPSMPLTSSWEIDVGALVGMGTARTSSEERILPRTGLERTIAAIWREVLHVDAIDVHTSFFALGGQSVLLVQVLSKLQKALGRELSVIDLFRYPSVSALASYLEKAEAAPKRSVHKATERAQKQREAARQRILTRGRPGPGDNKNP